MHFFRHFLLLVILVLASLSIKAQTEEYTMPHTPRNFETNPSKNLLYIELGGNAGLYSLNYERVYFYKEKLKMGLRGGFALNLNGIYVEQAYLLEHNFILFKNPHHLELGLGISLQRRYNEKPNSTNTYFWENLLFSTWRCGYRYQKQDDGFFLRAGILPIVMSHDALGFHPDYFQLWGGVSVGMSF